MAPRLHFLRPYSLQPLSAAGAASRCSAYLRLYEVARATGVSTCRRQKSTSTSSQADGDYTWEERSALMAARLKELRPAGGLEYPRLTRKAKLVSLRAFRAEFEARGSLDLANVTEQYTLCGRVLHLRRLGSKLFFVKILQDGMSIQAMVNFGKLGDGTDAKQFKAMAMLLKRGDHISVTGRPARSDSMELSIEARHLPNLLSPSLAPLPFQVPEDSRMHNRHMDLLLNRPARDILLVRTFIVNHLREHLHKALKCVEVQTPILAANAGGAVARPFSTRATEFPHKELALRIAPELWLKRLVVGGFDRVFEIGTSFRNEGLDATHNPEFTTCEFYMAYANLESLLNVTQNIVSAMAKGVNAYVKKKELQVESLDPKIFEKRFERVEFIPALEEALGQPLPRLESQRAARDIIELLEDAGKDWHRSLPPNPSLSKLLDHMAAAVIEPKSKGRPLYIINHPVCMSPLAKSFTCPTTGQQVAARAELFFDGNELANMYEEENDPFKQRRKFVNQAIAKAAQQSEGAPSDDEPPHVIDEQYISVLESGLPPTGGWGCGVDRLVMLFTGAKRISDVLPFGNLRNIVGLAPADSQNQQDNPGETDRVAPFEARGSQTTASVEAGMEQAAFDRWVVPKRSPFGDLQRTHLPSDFDALSAASLLEVAEDIPPTNAEDSISERVARRRVPSIIENDYPFKSEFDLEDETRQVLPEHEEAKEEVEVDDEEKTPKDTA